VESSFEPGNETSYAKKTGGVSYHQLLRKESRLGVSLLLKNVLEHWILI
jgi:hypothetical protein